MGSIHRAGKASWSTSRLILTSLQVRYRKPQGPLRTRGPIERYFAPQLLGQETHQLHAERVGTVEIRARGKPHAGVPDHQDHVLFGSASQGDRDLSPAVVRKSILQAIGQQLIDQQATRNRVSHGYPDRI